MDDNDWDEFEERLRALRIPKNDLNGHLALLDEMDLAGDLNRAEKALAGAVVNSMTSTTGLLASVMELLQVLGASQQGLLQRIEALEQRR